MQRDMLPRPTALPAAVIAVGAEGALLLAAGFRVQSHGGAFGSAAEGLATSLGQPLQRSPGCALRTCAAAGPSSFLAGRQTSSPHPRAAAPLPQLRRQCPHHQNRSLPQRPALLHGGAQAPSSHSKTPQRPRSSPTSFSSAAAAVLAVCACHPFAAVAGVASAQFRSAQDVAGWAHLGPDARRRALAGRLWLVFSVGRPRPKGARGSACGRQHWS